MQATATQSPATAPETAAAPKWMNYSGPGEPKGVLWRDRYGTITLSSLPFALLMLSGLFVFTTHFSWLGLGVCFISWAVRQWAITGVYHRYFSHKSYKVGRVTQFLLALLGTTAAQKGPLWWAAHHRHHHGFSDTEKDLHSPKRGFWRSHWFWFLYHETTEVDYKKIVDFAKYPELRWLDKYWYLPPTVLGFGMFFIGGWHIVVWGFFVSTVILANLTYTINSFCHLIGKQRFHSGDTSRNNFVFALLLLGEGWHNNHHRYQQSARNGFYWWEVDITFYVIKLMSFVGLAWDLKPVPEKVLQEGRENDRLRREARKQGQRFAPPPRATGVRQVAVGMAGK